MLHFKHNEEVTLRWFQQEAIDSIFHYYNVEGKKGNPVIALPTGTGKTYVSTGFFKQVLQQWPNQRFILSTHVKELIAQQADKMGKIWPLAPFGVYSAGLKSRDFSQPIIFGGIASMYDRPELFGHRDIMFIDEAHLLNPSADTMYMDFIAGLRKTNPLMKVVGMTATDFRPGMGRITDGGLFTDVTYNMTTREGFQRLTAEGFLARLVPRPTETVLDVTGVASSTSTDDYNINQLQKAVDKQAVTYAALVETLKHGYNCKSWLVFAAGVEHAEHIAEMLNGFGIPTGVVHSKRKDRDETIKRFKRGELRCLVNNNVLTTGFDYPPIDLIVMLRPTKSASLWVQMLGRGTRPWGGGWLDIGGGEQVHLPHIKHNCLVLDFARNTLRLGPIDDPVIPKKKGEAPGDAPVKICDGCGNYNHASARFCEFCGEEFIFVTKIFEQASDAPLMGGEDPKVDVYEVDHVQYYRHQSKYKPLPSLKVVYICKGNINTFSEFVNLEHAGTARHYAHQWWHTRIGTEPPATIAAALTETGKLRVPSHIRVWTNKRPYPEILAHIYD